MPAPLLVTKTYIPTPGPGGVPRSRLNELLDEGLKRKLTLVSAPPGYGKTTLLSAWVADRKACPAIRGLQFSWLTLDESDNEPERLLTYLAAALQPVPPEGAQHIGLSAQFPRPADPDQSLAILLNDLARVEGTIVLVLEDFYRLKDETALRLVASFIERMPAQVSLYLATRVDPALPLARLRANNQLGEVRADDLRFTSTEAGLLFEDALGLHLSPAEVASLVKRTEGWAAGLQMAGLSLRSRPDASGFITSFSGSDRYISDYLMDEVLLRQPVHVREFLLKTSILEQLCAPLCQAMIDTPSSKAQYARISAGEMLTTLESANLFLLPLASDRRWYRYHSLFAELLQDALQQAWPEQVTGLHGCASRWYEEAGLITGAIHHALAAGDVERVARLVAGHVLAFAEHAELQVLLRQLHSLPEGDAACRPWLCVARAWALAYAGQLLAVEPMLRTVEDDLAADESKPSNPSLHGHIGAIRAYVEWIQGNFLCAIDLAWQADGELIDDEPAARAINLTTLGTSLIYRGDLAPARQALAQALQLSRQAGETHVTLLAGASLAYVQLLLGEYHPAYQICRDLLELAWQYAHHSGWLMPATCSIYAIQSAIHYEWNNLEVALQDAQQGLALGLRWGQADSLMVNYLYLSRVLCGLGEINNAWEMLLEAEKVAGQVSLWFHDLVSTAQVEFHLKQGNLEAAIAWSQQHPINPADNIPYDQEAEYRMRAWLLIEQGQSPEALDLLKKLLQLLEPIEAKRSVLHALLLQAMAYQSMGDLAQARISLERALAIGQASGFLRTFADKGKALRNLLAEMLASLRSESERGNTSRRSRMNYLDRVLAVFPGLEEQPAEIVPNAGPSPISARTGDSCQISGRELEVLRYLAGYLTVPEIASELYLSPHTVRSHVKSIYSKLNAHNRSEAILRARELGLL